MPHRGQSSVPLIPHLDKRCTVNVVIFAGGKFRENVGKTFHVWGNFRDTTHISFIKAYGFYFRVGVIFAKKTKARKTRKLPPRENFHVYSMPDCTKSGIRLFADNSLLYRRIQSHQDSIILQEDMAALEKGEKYEQMSFNPEQMHSNPRHQQEEPCSNTIQTTRTYTRNRENQQVPWSYHQPGLEKELTYQ